MVNLPEPYAEVDDLQVYWRTLTTAEQDRAQVLLGWAAQLIREQHGFADFDPVACAQVSMDMVKRAMVASGNGDGVTGLQQGMADMTVNQTFANPMGNLYLNRDEAHRLAGLSGRVGPLSITLGSNVMVPPETWNSQPSEQTAPDVA